MARVIPFPAFAERAPAQVPARRMELHEAARVEAAIERCPRVLPPAVADLVARDLQSLLLMRYLPGTGSLMAQVVDEVMKLPLPDIAA